MARFRSRSRGRGRGRGGLMRGRRKRIRSYRVSRGGTRL